jgi:replicative DNA helicase
VAEIIIAKQRNGPTGMVKLAFLKPITKFESLARGGGGDF